MAKLSLAEIRKLLEQREKQIQSLLARRDTLAAELEEVEQEIKDLEGGVAKRGRPKKTGKRGRPKKAGKRGRPKKTGKRGRPKKAATKKKAGKRGRPKKAATKKKTGKRGRPKKAATKKKAAKRGRPKKAAAKKKAGKRGRPKKAAAKKSSGASLADLAIKALQKSGKPMSVDKLANAVEKLGYKSKNTAQVLRLTAGRGGKIKKGSGDEIRLA